RGRLPDGHGRRLGRERGPAAVGAPGLAGVEEDEAAAVVLADEPAVGVGEEEVVAAVVAVGVERGLARTAVGAAGQVGGAAAGGEFVEEPEAVEAPFPLRAAQGPEPGDEGEGGASRLH